MAVISGPGIPQGPNPAQAKGDTNPADFQPIRIDAPSGQGNGNLLEFYKNGVLVASMDVNGNLLSASTAGLNSINNEGIQTVAMAADANQTPNTAQLQAGILVISGGTSLTAQRDIVLPIVAGAVLTVQNSSTGSQPLRFIGASGTGVVVGNGQRALIYCDGTNWLRASPDTPNATTIFTPGRSVITVTDADATLTATQAQASIVEVSGGTYTAGRNVILPTNSGQQYTVANLQGGAFAATFKTAAGTGVAVAQNKRAIIYCDGANYVRVTPDT